MLSAVVVALLAQISSVTPSLIRIPAGQRALDVWPDYYSDPQVGYATFTIVYVVPSGGISIGGSVAFGLGYKAEDLGNNPAYSINSGWMFGPTDTLSKFPIGQIQRTTPSGANYCAATTSSGLITVSTLAHAAFGREVLLKVTAQTAMAAGTTWTITLGSKSSGGPGMTLSWQPGSVGVLAMQDFQGTGLLTPDVASIPTILVTGDHVDHFIVNGPVTPKVGIPTSLTIRTVLGADNPTDDPIMPVEDFSGQVHLSCTDPLWISSSSPVLQFSPADHGVRRITVTFNTPGIQLVTAQLYKDAMKLDDEIIANSNSMLVQDAASDLVVYCGDLQRHSGEGGHASVPDRRCWNDLWNQRQDFGAVVQHSELYMAGFGQAVETAKRFQAERDPLEAQFACLPGYEWGLPGSHRHVVYQHWTSDPAIACGHYSGFEIPPPIVEGTSVGSFLNRLATMPSDCPHLAIPHHSTWNRAGAWTGAYDWGPTLDSPMQPVVEIFSKHGSSEVYLPQATNPDDYLMHFTTTRERAQTDLASVRDALKLGYKFGIIAGSDQHQYHTECNGVENYTRSGLAFVRASRQDSIRDGTWKGLLARHCYGTTGARIFLNWTETTTGTAMGDECSTSSPAFAVEAHASGIGRSDRPEFTRQQIIRDDQVVESRTIAASDISTTYADATPLSGTHAYYVRLTQDDWQVAWSSPIFVTTP